jgi:hypothetical protein
MPDWRQQPQRGAFPCSAWERGISNRYPEVVLEYSKVVLRYSKVVLRYSKVVLRYSKVVLRYSKVVLRYSKVVLEYFKLFSGIFYSSLSISFKISNQLA